MKNVKVNEKYFVPKKSKRKYILVPLAFAATIVLVGSVFAPDGEKARIKNIENTGEEQVTSGLYKSNTDSIIDEVDDDVNISMNSIASNNDNRVLTHFTNTDLNEFMSYINSVQINYEYEDFYKIEASLKEYNKLNIANTHTNKISDISVSTLLKIVKNNNENYIRDNDIFIYDEIEDDKLSEIITIVVNTINGSLKQNKNISEDRIRCLLSDLKIFEQPSSLSNAFVSNDNCLVISPNMFKIIEFMEGEETQTDVIIHEIEHLLQKSCNCDFEKNENLKMNFGISYKFNNVDVNALDFSWFIEASAEKLMSNYTGHETFVYASKIGYLESLSMANLLNDNYNVNDTENLSLLRTLDDLFKYFNAQTESDKMEILKLMYSINVMQETPDDFYNSYSKKTGNQITDDVKDDIIYTVKSSICQTLSKLFYKNLANFITNKDVPLNDVFYLISLFENDINNHILYDSVNLYNYNESFINTYLSIQQNFFFQLSKSNQYSQEEIENLFNNYCSKAKTSSNEIIDNYDLSYLSPEKVDYLNERKEILSDVATANVSQVSKYFTNTYQKALKSNN